MANAWARDRATIFYPGIGLMGLVVVGLGFGVTHAVPMARGAFSAPWFVHLHGASALCWIPLALVLAYLPILIAMLRDQRRCGRNHPVWRYLGPALVIGQSLEVAFFDRGIQRRLGEWLYAFLA